MENRVALRAQFVFKGSESDDFHSHHNPMRSPIVTPIPADGGYPGVTGIEPVRRARKSLTRFGEAAGLAPPF